MPDAGLRGVVAAHTALSDVDGARGQLIYRGYDIRDLAAAGATFEDVIYLLWEGDAPTRAQLARLRRELSRARGLGAAAERVIDEAPRQADPMDVLRTAVSAAGLDDPDAAAPAQDGGANRRKALRLTAQLPTMVARFHRRRTGQPLVEPPAEASIAEGFLHALTGSPPDAEDARVFDLCLVLHADHGLNASTFAARVTAATLSDMHSAITSAVATLKGPLHGGANERVMELLLECKDPQDARAKVLARLAAHEKVMGFGHAVYRTMDPRAAVLHDADRELAQRKGTQALVAISEAIQQVMLDEKSLYPNVDFYSASVYYSLGIPIDLYTPIFAMSRVSGWTAHVLEQYADNKLIRPESEYVGPPRRRWPGGQGADLPRSA